MHLFFWLVIGILCSTGYVAERPMMTSVIRNALGAWKQSIYEQKVEDTNAIYKFNNYLDRRLIVLPLLSKLSPAKHGLMLGKERYSDKCSMPQSVGTVLYKKLYEMPWTFEISRNEQHTGRFDTEAGTTADTTREPSQSNYSIGKVKTLYASALDFRAPENYIFMPPWMMRSLGLASYDIVDVRFLKIHPVSHVTLQPLTTDWDRLVDEEGDNVQSILENEINKFSTLTAGTIIVVNVRGRDLPIFVKETKSNGAGGREITVNGVCIQDADVRTTIDRSRIPPADSGGSANESLLHQRMHDN